FPSAARHDFSISAKLSIFRRFHLSAYAALLATKRVVLCKTSARIRRLLARNELPVSVTSTMASASLGGLTSVAPQENSTCASTPCLARKLLVSPTTSVAMRLPARSATALAGESSGTHSTQRTGRRLTFENISSQTSCTWALFSSTQSCPVMPA